MQICSRTPAEAAASLTVMTRLMLRAGWLDSRCRRRSDGDSMFANKRNFTGRMVMN